MQNSVNPVLMRKPVNNSLLDICKIKNLKV